MQKRKYRLIKDLPDANIGTILTWNESMNCYIGEKSIWVSPHRYLTFSAGTVTQTPEWFEEVKEEFEILSYIGASCRCDGTCPYRVSDCKIYSIKRNSDSEIFKVGDKINRVDINKEKIRVIKKFWLPPTAKGEILYILCDDGSNLLLTEIKHYKELILVTEDGYECTLDDKVFGVLPKGNWEIKDDVEICRFFDHNGDRYSTSSPWKYFSTKELRDKYLNDNKLLFSRKDLRRLTEGLKKQTYFYWDIIVDTFE